jgi:hypothetical protein
MQRFHRAIEVWIHDQLGLCQPGRLIVVHGKQFQSALLHAPQGSRHIRAGAGSPADPVIAERLDRIKFTQVTDGSVHGEEGVRLGASAAACAEKEQHQECLKDSSSLENPGESEQSRKDATPFNLQHIYLFEGQTKKE